MPSVIQTSQWVNIDRPVLGAFSLAYLIEEDGIIGVTTDEDEATHIMAESAGGIVGVESYRAGFRALLVNGAFVPFRIPAETP